MTILSYNQRRRPPLDAVVAAVLVISAILVVSSKTSSSCCVAFVTTYCPRQVRMFDYYNSNRLQYRPLFMARGPTNNNDGNDDNENEYFNEIPSDTSFDTNKNPHKQSNQITTTTTTIRNDTIPLTDLRLTKARLEHQHTRQFVTKQPLKLPYAVSQKWIQHHFSITTKEEFEQLVSDGDIKNVYISKRPEEYYGRRGEWISWDHYLLGSCGEEDGYRNNGKNGTAVSLLKWQ